MLDAKHVERGGTKKSGEQAVERSSAHQHEHPK